MSRETLGLNYKEGQIIKHALQHYAKRDEPQNEVDIQAELRLLDRVEKFIDDYKRLITGRR